MSRGKAIGEGKYIIACYSDLISYEEKATPHPGTVRAIRIC